MSFVAKIDFDSYTYEQLEKILDMLPVKKVIISNVYNKDNPTIFNTDSIDIDITDNRIFGNPEKENEYKQQIAYTKYQKMLELLKEKSIELLDETSAENYQGLNLYDENIEDNLSAVSNDNSEVFIDISDLFKDVTVYNSFIKLTQIFGEIKDKEELSVTDNFEFINKESLMDINTERISKLLACA